MHLKSVIIIAIAFVLLIPLSVFAQEESLSELTARLDAENLERTIIELFYDGIKAHL